jgi:predicted nucleic acid-binding protein
VSFLLDTNVVTELRKGTRANAGVLEWIGTVDDGALFVSVMVAGELRQGIERLRLRDPVGAQRLDRWMHALLDDYAERILPVDARIADLWGRLNVPDPLPAIDGLLAATAIVYDLTFVTRDVRGVERTGVRVLDPFRS